MNSWPILLNATLLGLMGSLHCIGMCGPIVYAIPVGRFTGLSRVFGVVLYHLGRVVAYTGIGLLAGAAGFGLALGRYQQQLSVIIGVGMVLWAVIPVLNRMHFRSPVLWVGLLGSFQARMGKLLREASLPALFGVGLINGLLPCGLVYTAITGALGMASLSGGGLFMMLFGIGTIPALAALMLLGSSVKERIAPFMRIAMPVTVAVLGVLLILRGLNLGIPYVSPVYDPVSETVGSCCSGR